MGRLDPSVTAMVSGDRASPVRKASPRNGMKGRGGGAEVRNELRNFEGLTRIVAPEWLLTRNPNLATVFRSRSQ
jgi:hypothetical protein